MMANASRIFQVRGALGLASRFSIFIIRIAGLICPRALQRSFASLRMTNYLGITNNLTLTLLALTFPRLLLSWLLPSLGSYFPGSDCARSDCLSCDCSGSECQ